MVISPSSLDLNLNQILQDVNACKIQLPEFQRSWTWDDIRIKGIIASISQGYPMGAIMRLQYGNPSIKIKYRVFEGVKDTGTEPDFLVLDGQQRITSIFQSVFSKDPVSTKTDKGKEIKRYYYLMIEDCLNNDIDRVDAVLAVPSDKKLKTDFDRVIKLDLSTVDNEYMYKAFPVNIVFDQIALMNWQFGYMQKYALDSAAIKLFQEFIKDVITPITSYKLPVITLDKATPKDAVCKVFENVNTGGVPLTVFELVTAMFATEGFNLRDDWKQCKNKICGYGSTLRTDLLDDVDETTFLTAVTLYVSYLNKQSGLTGYIGCKRKDVLSLTHKDYVSNRDKIVEGFELAKEFLLQYQFVFRKRDLPYATQLIPLSAICAILGKSKCSEPNVIKILTKWYWCGILGEMYGGANETRYANDIEDVLNEINGVPSLNRTINSSFFSATRLLTMQTRNSAAYKGVMALLYKEKCRDFMNDLSIDIVNSMLESPDIHHIFPEAYCIKVGIAKSKYNSIINKTPILPKTNRTIGGRAPSLYLQTIMKNVSGLNESELRARIESHKVDYDLLKADNFNDYYIKRAIDLLNLIELAMDKKVTDRNSSNTIKQFGQAL